MCIGGGGGEDPVREDTVDWLKDAAEHAGVPSMPLEVSSSMIRSQAESMDKITGAMREVANGIDGQTMDMDKVREVNDVGETLQRGVIDGVFEGIKGAVQGIFDWAKSN